jgi:hypothetical protein
MNRKTFSKLVGVTLLLATGAAVQADNRVSASKKGSLLIYSKIELKWTNTGALKQDTFLTIVNDDTQEVRVKWYFINGDEPTDPVVVGPTVVERAHKGWSWVDCETKLSEDESLSLSMATGRGNYHTCSPFTITDPSPMGQLPGRPDPDGPPGHRILRGYAVAFAVDAAGYEISHNHLAGGVNIVSYSIPAAWEFNTWAFQALSITQDGDLHLDGTEYDYSFNQLLYDFFAVGSDAFSNGATTVMLDGDLTLFPVDVDLRQDSHGPVTTKAKFEIWNENEDGRSGTIRCITCWDQALLSTYDSPNNFLIDNLGTDKGKARIDGVESADFCDDECEWRFICDLAGEHQGCGWVWWCEVRSKDASLLGVAGKVLAFSGAVGGSALSGTTLVGQGTEEGKIKYDVESSPDTLTDPTGNLGTMEIGGIGGVQPLTKEAAKGATRTTGNR